jgi:hypothetical protein
VARPFNRYIRGLLSQLDAKVEGRGPREFNEVLAPVLDVERLLNYGQAEQVFNTAALVSGVGFFSAGLPGPDQTEIFLILDYGVVMTSALSTAGDIVYGCPAIERRPGTAANIQAIGPIQRFVFPEGAILFATGGPWVMFPNEQLGWWAAQSVIGGAEAMQYSLKFVRLKV